MSLRESPQEVEASFHTSPYREVPAFELHVMSAREMMAEKVRAIMTRDKPRDVYDLWFLSRKVSDLDIGLVQRKLDIYNLVYEPDDLIADAEAMRGAWRRDLGSLVMGRLPDFDEVMGDLRKYLV